MIMKHSIKNHDKTLAIRKIWHKKIYIRKSSRYENISDNKSVGAMQNASFYPPYWKDHEFKYVMLMFPMDTGDICTSNHMFKKEIWDKFTEFTFF